MSFNKIYHQYIAPFLSTISHPFQEKHEGIGSSKQKTKTLAPSYFSSIKNHQNQFTANTEVNSCIFSLRRLIEKEESHCVHFSTPRSKTPIKFGRSTNTYYMETWDRKKQKVHIELNEDGTASISYCHFNDINFHQAKRKKLHPNDSLLNWLREQIQSYQATANLSIPGASYIIGSYISSREQEQGIGYGYDWKIAYSQHTEPFNLSHSESIAYYAQKADSALIAFRGVLSNFQQFSIYDPLTRETFSSAEHIFQYYKVPPSNHSGRAQVLAAKTPSNARDQANRLTKSRMGTKGKSWGNASKELMIYIQLLKAYEKGSGLKAALEASGNAFIIEDSSSRHYSSSPDKTWGDNGNGEGKNQLGWSQMIVRDIIKSHHLDETFLKQFYTQNVEPLLRHYWSE